MSEISHVVEYYEGLHLRRNKKEFSIQEEINWILLNGEDSTKIVDMYLCLDDFQESLYETNLQAPVTNANEIISVMHTLLNQLDEQ